jgi:Methyltransferase domain
MRYSIHDVYKQIFKIWRRKRFDLFVQLLSLQPGQRLIDIGGYPGFWTQHPPVLGTVDTLNVHPVDWDRTKFPEYHIETLVGDGCALQFPDKSYDVAFSNSVIEHVGSWNRQQVFAREIRRIGKAVWVQTPAFECPIEPHYLAPFVHWLPKAVQRKVIRWLTPWGWLQNPSTDEVRKMVETTRLLKKREMQELFPDCEICTEWLLGFIPKSYVAFRKNPNAEGHGVTTQ